MRERMSIEQAKQVIREEAPDMVDLFEAVGALSSIECNQTTYDDLIECLRRGGVLAELAAIGLHARTNRQRRREPPYSVSYDAVDWLRYLREHGFWEGPEPDRD